MEFEKELDDILKERAKECLNWLKDNQKDNHELKQNGYEINLSFLSNYLNNKHTNSLVSSTNKLFYLTIILAILTLLMLVSTLGNWLIKYIL